MPLLKKNQSILFTLRDRELNVKLSAYHSTLNVISQLIRDKDSTYSICWTKASRMPVTYDGGILYYKNFTKCYTINGNKCRPTVLYSLKTPTGRKKISDVITYSSPVYKQFDMCYCSIKPCKCMSEFFMSISEDNWLCQHDRLTGEVTKEVYAKRIGYDFRFKHINWDIFGERIVLTSVLNPRCNTACMKERTDSVVNLAVFKVFPLEFQILLEIKRSIFGKECNHVNVEDQYLILGMGINRVHIYNFSVLLENGVLIPYKLGQAFGTDAKVGEFPLGIPCNFHYSTAPPLLFNVQCAQQTVAFGGYPFLYVTASVKDHTLYTVKSVNEGISIINGTLQSNILNDEPDVVFFHPDNSNRLIFRDSHVVHCYQVSSSGSELKLKETFSMYFPEVLRSHLITFSSSGRKIKHTYEFPHVHERSIFCMDYEDELNLLAIMGVHFRDPLNDGFIKLYDNFTGVEVKSIRLFQQLCETNFYQLYLDMVNIIIIEKNDRNMFNANVFKLHRM